jgi:hypothetical protein
MVKEGLRCTGHLSKTTDILMVDVSGDKLMPNVDIENGHSWVNKIVIIIYKKN